jgi:glycosyltransferase involved in cell wall biosynthesis
LTLALISNHPAPYRQHLFEELGRRLPGLVIVYEARESTARRWGSATVGYETEFMVDAPIEEVGPAQKAAATSRTLRRLRPDAVIASGFGPSAIAAWEWALPRRAALIGWSGATALADRHVRGGRLALRKRLARNARGWVAYGDEARAYLCGLGARPECVEPAGNPYGVEPASAPPSRAGNGPVRVGFAGQLHWRKGWWTAVQAVRLATDEGADVELNLVGDGPGAPLMRRLLEATGIPLASWRRHVPPEAMREFYAGLDLLLVPSFIDQWPIVASEAAAQGVAVACSPARHSGAPALVSTATEGPGPPPGAVAELAELVRSIGDDDQAAAAAGRVESARRILAPEAVADRWVSLIERCL